MAAENQIEANRLNAQKSTGSPRHHIPLAHALAQPQIRQKIARKHKFNCTNLGTTRKQRNSCDLVTLKHPRKHPKNTSFLPHFHPHFDHHTQPFVIEFRLPKPWLPKRQQSKPGSKGSETVRKREYLPGGGRCLLYAWPDSTPATGEDARASGGECR